MTKERYRDLALVGQAERKGLAEQLHVHPTLDGSGSTELAPDVALAGTCLSTCAHFIFEGQRREQGNQIRSLGLSSWAPAAAGAYKAREKRHRSTCQKLIFQLPQDA